MDAMERKIFIGKVIVGILTVLSICSLVNFFGNKKIDNDKVVISNISEKDMSSKRGEYQDSYFVYDKKNRRYLLFGEDDKRLTKEEYRHASEMRNNMAYINTPNGSNIITSGGDLLYDYKEKYIYEGNGVYLIADDAKKTLYNYKKEEINSYSKDAIIFGYDNYNIIKDHNTIYILDIEGKPYITLNEKSDDYYSYCEISKRYCLFRLKNKYTILFDSVDKKEIFKFDDKDNYSFVDFSKDLSKIIIGNDDKNYIYSNGKVTDITGYTRCSFLNSSDIIIAEKDNIKYILNDDGTIGLALDSTALYDDKNYAIEEGGVVSIFRDGKLINTLINASLQVSNYNRYYGYIINNNVYDLDGNLVLDKEDDAREVLPNGNIVMYTKSYNKYIVDKTGKKLTTTYNQIFSDSTSNYLYIRDKKDRDKEGLMNYDGKVIIKPEYNSVTIRDLLEVPIAKACTRKKCDYYNLNSNKKIATFKNNMRIEENRKYILGQVDNKIVYYSLNGNKLHETKK